MRNPASSNIISASVLLWDKAVGSSQAHEIGTNVCDPNIHMAPPEVDFESTRLAAKSASWNNLSLQSLKCLIPNDTSLHLLDA